MNDLFLLLIMIGVVIGMVLMFVVGGFAEDIVGVLRKPKTIEYFCKECRKKQLPENSRRD